MRSFLVLSLLMCALLGAVAPIPILEEQLQDRPVEFQPLSGGYGQASNYQFTSRTKRYVLRVFDAEDTREERAHEIAVTTLAGELAIGPPVVSSDPDERWLVLEFVEGRPVDLRDLEDPEALQALMGVVRRLHEASLPVPSGTTLFGWLRQRLLSADAAGVPMPFQLAAALQMLDSIEESIPEELLTVCHADLHLRNIIASEEGFWIIDWEDVTLCDPFFDIALLAWSLDQPADHLLEVYLGRSPTQAERRRLSQMHRLAHLQKFAQMFPEFEPERHSPELRRQRQLELSQKLSMGIFRPPSQFWRKFREAVPPEQSELREIALSCLNSFLQEGTLQQNFLAAEYRRDGRFRGEVIRAEDLFRPAAACGVSNGSGAALLDRGDLAGTGLRS